MAENDEDSKIPSDLTKSDRFDFKFRWTIADFLDFPGKNGVSVESKDFGGETAYVGVKWRINGLAYPQGDVSENEDWFGVFLVIKVTPENASLGIMAHYQVSLIGLNGQKKFTQRIDRSGGKWDLGLGRPTFAKLKLLEEFDARFLPNGNLTLEFEGTAYIRFNPEVLKVTKRKRYLKPAINVIRNLWENGTCSDVVIKADGKDFDCHKCVLSVRSEYFRAMFQSGMEGSRKRALDFSHQMNGEELKDLLEYLYLGKTCNSKTNWQTMLKVAEIFKVQELKSLSEKALIERLKPENAWELLVLAREHGAKSLQKEAYLLLAKSVD